MLAPISAAPSISGKRVLIRASLNVPITGGRITDTTRIKQTLPTIRYAKDHGAKVILISHHSGGAQATLRPILDALNETLKVSFVEDMFSTKGKKVFDAMNDGDVVLVENVRQYPGEEENDEVFAETLAACADVFVNDDFTVSHREHASIVRLPKLLPSYTGFRFNEEFEHLSKAFDPAHPAVLVLGGAKPETKLPLARIFLEKMDILFIGGIAANTLFREKGFETGTSVVGPNDIQGTAELLASKKVLLPIDVRVRTEDGVMRVKAADRVEPTDMIVDAGPETMTKLADTVKKAAFVLWNGPLGDYELGYTQSTYAAAEMLTESKAYTVIGGGDTVAAIATLGLNDKFTFVSTAGGAMIDFLANGTLPGIEALREED